MDVFASYTTGHRICYINDWNNSQLYRKRDNNQVGNLKLGCLNVNMNIIVGSVLPREHINSCDQAKGTDTLQIN